jgi:hypothetical protein
MSTTRANSLPADLPRSPSPPPLEVSQYRAGDFSTNYHTPPGIRIATDASVLGPPASPSTIIPLDLRANAQVEPMEEDPGSGVLQIVDKGEEEEEIDWEPESQRMEESSNIFDEVMYGLRQKEVYESLVARLRDDPALAEFTIQGLRARILKLSAPLFKQQRQVRERKTAEQDRKKMALIEWEKEEADRRVEMQQMQRLKKDEEEAEEAKWKYRMEKWRMEEEDHTPLRNKRGFARPAALTPYGTVLRVSQ